MTETSIINLVTELAADKLIILGFLTYLLAPFLIPSFVLYKNTTVISGVKDVLCEIKSELQSFHFRKQDLVDNCPVFKTKK